MNHPSDYYEVVTRWDTGVESRWICWLGLEAARQEQADNRSHPRCVSCRVYKVQQRDNSGHCYSRKEIKQCQ